MPSGSRRQRCRRRLPPLWKPAQTESRGIRNRRAARKSPASSAGRTANRRRALRCSWLAVTALDAANVKTDASGKFELEWNQRQFAGQSDSTACVLVRDAEHNLAVAQDMDEDTTHLDLRLAPGLTLAGRAECDGKPAHQRDRRSWFSGPAAAACGCKVWRAPTRRGQFEIPALPPGRKYGVIVSAPGYGQKQITILKFPPKPAARNSIRWNSSRPTSNSPARCSTRTTSRSPACNVNLNGEGQPNAQRAHGPRWTIYFRARLRRRAQISANSQSSYGSVSAEGGDTNVVLRLGQNIQFFARRHSRTNLKGMVTDADGKPAAGAQVAVFPEQRRALGQDRNQRRIQPHLVAPAVADAERRRAAGGPRPGPQSGGHARSCRRTPRTST